MNRNQIVKAVQWVWIIFVLLASGYYIISRWGGIADIIRTIPITNLLLSMVFLVFGKLFLAFLSKQAIQSEGVNISYMEMFRIFSITQLGKYLPGGIWHFVGRLNAYHDRELSLKKSGKALFLETTWLIGSALSFGLVLVIIFGGDLNLFAMIGWHISPYMAAGIAFLFLSAWFMVLYLAEMFFVSVAHLQKFKFFLILIMVQGLVWTCLGLSFAFIFPSMDFRTFPSIIGVYAISWAVGYIIIFAPGGIGIRELVLTFLLGNLLIADNAIILSTLHRFLYIVVEVMLGIIAGLTGLSGQKKD